MAIQQLTSGKPADARTEDGAKVRATVETIVADIARRGDAAVRDLSPKFDGYTPPAIRHQRITTDAAAAMIGEYGPRPFMREGSVGPGEQCTIRVRREGGKNAGCGMAAE